MTKFTLKALLIIAVVACLVPGALADTFTLTGVGSPSTVIGGVYTGPYVATINGVAGIPVICDDYDTHTRIGDTWSVTGTTVDQIGGSDVTDAVKFDMGGGAAQANAYAAAASLAIEMVNLSDRYLAGIYNYAIWGIFTPTSLSKLDDTMDRWGGSAPTDRQYATLLRDTALADPGPTSKYSNVTIWTPSAPSRRSDAQEFITVPEPTTIALLLFNLLAVGGLLIFVRRRDARILS